MYDFKHISYYLFDTNHTDFNEKYSIVYDMKVLKVGETSVPNTWIPQLLTETVLYVFVRIGNMNVAVDNA